MSRPLFPTPCDYSQETSDMSQEGSPPELSHPPSTTLPNSNHGGPHESMQPADFPDEAQYTVPALRTFWERLEASKKNPWAEEPRFKAWVELEKTAEILKREDKTILGILFLAEQIGTSNLSPRIRSIVQAHDRVYRQISAETSLIERMHWGTDSFNVLLAAPLVLSYIKMRVLYIRLICAIAPGNIVPLSIFKVAVQNGMQQYANAVILYGQIGEMIERFRAAIKKRIIEEVVKMDRILSEAEEQQRADLRAKRSVADISRPYIRHTEEEEEEEQGMETTCPICMRPYFTATCATENPAPSSNDAQPDKCNHVDADTDWLTDSESDSDEPAEPTDDSETPVQLPCAHIFGRNCLHSWITSPAGNASRCPFCRVELFPNEPEPTPLQPNWESTPLRRLIGYLVKMERIMEGYCGVEEAARGLCEDAREVDEALRRRGSRFVVAWEGRTWVITWGGGV